VPKELVDELQAFKETDWECNDDDAEPNFNLGIKCEPGDAPANLA
jgi:hypothetical protein